MVLAIGAVVMIVLPLAGLLERVPWSSLVSDLSAHDAYVALRLSLETSLGALAVAVVFGLPLAWILARRR
ncbi:MAG TPA: molybdate ABC transporter permease subunit, partial [Acidimicrobiales bacterium]|nr:molybdate ABC transporter permease subunit [Acidimicrobiales bacterium]